MVATCVVAGISVVVTECFMVCRYVVGIYMFMIVIVCIGNRMDLRAIKE